MSSFRNIDYGKLLYETLRSYFAVNSDGDISIMYKYLAAFVAPLQVPFNNYVAYRAKEALIANCKWQVGQLTNVLNHLYDPEFNSIWIGQTVVTVVTDPMFQYDPYNFDGTFSSDPYMFERKFDDQLSSTIVSINVPHTVNLSDLKATVEQIRMKGIPYQIGVF